MALCRCHRGHASIKLLTHSVEQWAEMVGRPADSSEVVTDAGTVRVTGLFCCMEYVPRHTLGDDALRGPLVNPPVDQQVSPHIDHDGIRAISQGTGAAALVRPDAHTVVGHVQVRDVGHLRKDDAPTLVATDELYGRVY